MQPGPQENPQGAPAEHFSAYEKEVEELLGETTAERKRLAAQILAMMKETPKKNV